MNSKSGVILTGGDFQGLAVLRTLAEKSIPIVLVDHELSIARFSKYKKKFFKSPHPSNTEEYVDFIIRLVKHEKLEGWVIIPNSDQIVYNISKFKELLSKYLKVPVPTFDTIEKVYNKRYTYELCQKNNISIPEIYTVNSISDLAHLDCKFPLVIKPAIRDNFYSKIKIKAFRVNNKHELISTYDFVKKFIPENEILIQEYINGGPKNLYSCCPFFKENKILYSITGRRSRQHPMEFGHATTYAELVDIPELQQITQKFLSIINYYGICEVEFMFDTNSGQYKLIEVNPRVWGWHSLAIGAGYDLPYILYLDTVGEKYEIDNIFSQLKWLRLLTDFVTSAKEMTKGNLKLKEYIQSLKGEKVFAVFSKKDPLPFIMELFMIPYLWKKRGF